MHERKYVELTLEVVLPIYSYISRVIQKPDEWAHVSQGKLRQLFTLA